MTREEIQKPEQIQQQPEQIQQQPEQLEQKQAQPQLPAVEDLKKNEKFSADEALAVGWAGMKQYWLPYTGILVTVYMYCSIPSLLAVYCTYVNSSAPVITATILVTIAFAVFKDWVDLGQINIALMALDGKKVFSKDIFSTSRRLLPYVAAGFLYKLMVFLGLVCFIIPGIIVQVKYQYFGFFVLDKGLGPLQSLRASEAITKGAKVDLVIFNVVLCFINALGNLIFFIGGVFAFVLTAMANAHVYRQLLAVTPEAEWMPTTQTDTKPPPKELTLAG